MTQIVWSAATSYRFWRRRRIAAKWKRVTGAHSKTKRDALVTILRIYYRKS